MKKKIIYIAFVLGAFVIGSLKGDDLLESWQRRDVRPLGEAVEENLNRPLNHDEIKAIGRRIMVESGHDLSESTHIHGMTIEAGYIVTALAENDRFLAQVYISKDLNRAECSKKM